MFTIFSLVFEVSLKHGLKNELKDTIFSSSRLNKKNILFHLVILTSCAFKLKNPFEHKRWNLSLFVNFHFIFDVFLLSSNCVLMAKLLQNVDLAIAQNPHHHHLPQSKQWNSKETQMSTVWLILQHMSKQGNPQPAYMNHSIYPWSLILILLDCTHAIQSVFLLRCQI